MDTFRAIKSSEIFCRFVVASVARVSRKSTEKKLLKTERNIKPNGITPFGFF